MAFWKQVKNQVQANVGNNQKVYILLMGMQNSVATLENSWQFLV